MSSTSSGRDFFLDWIPVRVYYTEEEDTTEPTDPADVASTSHVVDTPISDNTIDMAWSAAGEEDGATDDSSGVDGYSYAFTTGAGDVPDVEKDAEEAATGMTSDPLGEFAWYFHLRTVDNEGNWSSTVTVGPFPIDTTAPVLSEVTPVSSPTNSSTPDYTFNSSEAGSISYSGDCSSATTAAVSGDNTITFNALSDGTYSDCTITVTDSAGNPSDPLSVSTFTVDTNAPTVKSAQTQDQDGDGYIDGIKLTFSENIDDSRLDSGNPDGWDVVDYDGEAIGTGEGENDNILLLTFSEGESFDTGSTPVVTYTPSGGGDLDPRSTHDTAGNELGSYEASADDKALPVLLSAFTRDTDTNGQIDAIELTFSEDIDDEQLDDSEFADGDGWDVDGYSDEVIGTGENENDNILLLAFSESENSDTGKI